MRKNILTKAIWISVMLCMGFVVLLYANNDIGISRGKLEDDIRSSQKIEESWSTVGNCSDTMAAYISYPEDKTDHTFSVYVNRPGLSFGFFFRGGGSLSGVDESITEFTVENNMERAFISMNAQHIVRLEFDDGSTTNWIEINEDRPFAIVLPVNAGTVTFYDRSGNSVEYIKNKL